MQLHVERRELHFRTPARTSRGDLAARALWLLRAADPVRPAARPGWGECGPIPGLSADDSPAFAEELHAFVEHFNARAPRLDSADPHAVAAVLEPDRAWLERLPSLRFGLETALIDAAAGRGGILWPSPFATGGAPLPTHGLLWMDTPDGLLEQARAKLRAGFRVLKLKVGALEAAAEQALLRRIVGEADGVTLRLDANGAWTPAAALEFLCAVADLPIEFVEQPLAPGQQAALRALCAASPLPLALDEELIGVRTPDERRALLDAVRPHHLILKPALLGGFAACDDWIDACAAAGVQWWANSLLESAIGHDAICQWTAARAPDRIHGLGTGALFRDNLPTRIRLEGASLVRAPVAG